MMILGINQKGSSNEYGSLLGGIDDLNTYPSNLSLILAFGNLKYRIELIRI